MGSESDLTAAMMCQTVGASDIYTASSTDALHAADEGSSANQNLSASGGEMETVHESKKRGMKMFSSQIES